MREKLAAEKQINRRTKKSNILDGQPHSTGSATPDGGYQTSDAARKAVYRAKQSLPNSPNKYAQVVKGLMKSVSPRKASALKAQGVHHETGLVVDGVIRSLQASLKELKNKRADRDRHIRKLLVSSVLVKKKYRKIRAQANMLGLPYGFVRNCTGVSVSEINRARKTRSDKIASNISQSVVEFYKQPDVSRELPMMRTVSKKTMEPRRVMEVSTDDAYRRWTEENQHIKLSAASFKKMRPKSIKPIRTQQLNQCLCEKCTNVMLMLRAVNSAAARYNFFEVKVKDKYDLVNLTLCEREHGNHSIECVERLCTSCGVKNLEKRFETLINKHGEENMSWLTWEVQKSNVTVDGVAKVRSRKVIAQKINTLNSLVQQLIHDADSLAKHLFVASWQHRQYSNLTRSVPLPANTVVMVLDFAQNYNCINQDEIQSAHWTNVQVTLHPIVTFYNCTNCTTDHTIQEALVFISDDLTHDTHAVQHFITLANSHLSEHRDVTIEKQIQFSDGCASQYKSKGAFCDLSYCRSENGFAVERHFFGSQHGKGPCDGDAGTVKTTVRQALVAHKVVVGNGKQIYSFCHEKLTKDGLCTNRQSFLLVPNDVIERNRLTRNVTKSVQGTRQLLAVRGLAQG
ncbi:uncharacterized protein [Ptychodera flava]|uniref:uncharacterized protein n=1 Tax=Ptychodera flava TaxID=63121 RepID=UPI003969F42D